MTIALVLGSASTVWADVDAALSLGEFDAVVTCNDITVAWRGEIAAAASYHPECWALWLERRRRANLPAPARLFGHAEFNTSHLRNHGAPIEYVESRLPGQVQTGSSGLFAVKVALEELGHDRAVLCGMPLDERPHFFDQVRWRDPATYRRGWTEALPAIRDRVRSMSGWTSRLLGRPSEEWIR